MIVKRAWKQEYVSQEAMIKPPENIVLFQKMRINSISKYHTNCICYNIIRRKKYEYVSQEAMINLPENHILVSENEN